MKTYTHCKHAAFGLSATLFGVALTGCGNNADNAATETTGSATTQIAATPVRPDAIVPETPAAPANTAAFAGAAATWKQIQSTNAQLDKLIKANKLLEVHEVAFKIRDLANTLPAKSAALSAEKQKSLASAVKTVAQIAVLLDESGDAKKLKETRENQASMNDALAIIKGIYPPGALG